MADEISHTLPATRHRCKLEVALAQTAEIGSTAQLVTLDKVLNLYNKDFI